MLIIEHASARQNCRAERRLRVGRSNKNDLVITQSTVSSFHAPIEWRQNGYYVRDLGSVNGTYCGETRPGAWTRLLPGSPLRFGRTRLRLGPDQVLRRSGV
jgi:pSer/pThr/pTyr-binding forkhead associated (FHA) protein